MSLVGPGGCVPSQGTGSPALSTSSAGFLGEAPENGDPRLRERTDPHHTPRKPPRSTQAPPEPCLESSHLALFWGTPRYSLGERSEFGTPKRSWGEIPLWPPPPPPSYPTSEPHPARASSATSEVDVGRGYFWTEAISLGTTPFLSRNFSQLQPCQCGGLRLPVKPTARTTPTPQECLEGPEPSQRWGGHTEEHPQEAPCSREKPEHWL